MRSCFKGGLQNDLENINSDEHLHKYLEYSEAIKKEQPFVGETVWSTYFMYHQFIGRIAVLLLLEKDKKAL